MIRQQEPQQNLWKWIFWGGVLVALFIGFPAFLVMTAQPTSLSYPPSDKQLDPVRLKKHVVMLSETFAPRNYERHWNLEKTANYVSNHLARAGGEMSEQVFKADGRKYRNVIAEFGPPGEERIVVGAHYDTFRDTPGADDNASGVAGLIELAYLLGKADLNQRVELVAYTLEEPPFFRSGNMGSARHAYRSKKDGVRIEAMLCLEMIGYFTDQEKSQHYSSVTMKLLYPDTGNFIGVISRMADRKLAKAVKISMRSATDLPVHCMCAPEGHPGIDFSDHRNYWSRDYPAVMITDTAFMRNTRYHQRSDVAETLNYESMAKVVLGVYEAVVRLAND